MEIIVKYLAPMDNFALTKWKKNDIMYLHKKD